MTGTILKKRINWFGKTKLYRLVNFNGGYTKVEIHIESFDDKSILIEPISLSKYAHYIKSNADNGGISFTIPNYVIESHLAEFGYRIL